jgi:hypothetical protein
MLWSPPTLMAQATVRGVPIGATCKLTDSLLNPAVPVTLTWSATLGGWEGPGNGLVYRLVHEDIPGWHVRILVTEGTTTGDYELVRQPVDLDGVTPLRWSGSVPITGPTLRAYGLDGFLPTDDKRLSITITP